MDQLIEELEHLEFLDECHTLVEQIFASWMNRSLESLQDEWHDIRVYGDEPVFADLLFSKLEEESV